MLRELFEGRFLRAAAYARDFARGYVEERLPDAMRFRVQLNASYDGNATSEDVLFPEDTLLNAALLERDLTASEVIDLLWRDGLVPQWVNVSVIWETGDTTRLEIAACGRFVTDERRLYYLWTDVAPFGVKGPVLPVGYVEGRRFSLYERSSCTTVSDLARVVARAEKVWSLELHGALVDDEVLASLPTFARLEILELSGARLSGAGLVCVAKMPALHHVRIGLAEGTSLRLDALPRHEALESIAIRANTLSVTGVRHLAKALASLKELTFATADSLELDASLATCRVEKLDLNVPLLFDWAAAPTSLVTLTICSTRADDAQVARVLDSCPVALASLSLRGTPVTSAILERLARFGELRFLDVVDTQIPRAALERFAADRPRLRTRPRETASLNATTPKT